MHFCHCVQRFWSNHCQVHYLVQCLDSRLVFHLLHKASHSFCISNILCGEKVLTFKRIFSQRYYMVTQLAAHFSILNTKTQLVVIKFFDKFLYGDIAHRSHVETINRMILWHKTTKYFNSEAQTVINHYLYLWKYTGLYNFLNKYNPVTVCFLVPFRKAF